MTFSFTKSLLQILILIGCTNIEPLTFCKAFNSDPLYVFSKHPDTVDKTLTELTKYNPTLVLVILPNDHSFHGKRRKPLDLNIILSISYLEFVSLQEK